MIRRAAAAAALIGLALAATAAAGPPGTVFDNRYEGRVERTPNTYLGFDVVKGGVKKIARVSALLHYNCSNGDGGDAAGRVRGKLRVEDGAFAGTLRGNPLPFRAASFRGPAPSRIKYRVRGTLLKKGKARGTIDATLTFTPTLRGGERVRCYTGELDWRARRGADAPVAP